MKRLVIISMLVVFGIMVVGAVGAAPVVTVTADQAIVKAGPKAIDQGTLTAKRKCIWRKICTIIRYCVRRNNFGRCIQWGRRRKCRMVCVGVRG